MKQQLEQQQAPTANQQLLATFIHELNLARRSFSLYPPEHPQVASSNSRALQTLLKLQSGRTPLTFGVSAESLFFDQQWLDKHNRAYREFAGFLYQRGIAALSFLPGLVFSELLRFNQLLCRERGDIEAAGGFPPLLEAQQIQHILVTPIDYSAFRAKTDNTAQPADLQPLWEGFLQGLLNGSLDTRGEAADWFGQLDPAIIAEALNLHLSSESSAVETRDRVAATLVDKLLVDEPAAQQPAGQQLGNLLEQLNPQLRDSFLANTLESLDHTPDSAEQVLANLPKALLVESLHVQKRRQLNISSRLIKLVKKFSATPTPATGYTQKKDPEALDDEVVLARLNVLFNEESQDLYMPGSYQHALQEILDKEQLSAIPEQEQQALKATLEQQSIERQCSAIIFELLEGQLTAESETALQQNLVELSRFFLDTGDFIALREIYRRWTIYQHSNRAQSTVLNEMVRANHQRPAFMAEVLDGIELWGKAKFADISAYLAVVGEAYSEPLIERLGLEQRLTMRRVWMQLLEAIGVSAHQAIIPALNDQRWYLVRNLLNVIGQKPDLAALKAIQQLSNHPHPKVRQEVLRILLRLNPAGGNRLLHKELDSDDLTTQLAAVEIAHLSRAPEVLTKLLQLLQQEIKSTADLERKVPLLKALARIGSPDCLPVLRRLLQKKGLFVSRRQKQFQHEIISSLADYPRRSAEPLLQELARGRQRQHAKLATELLQQATGEPQ